MTKNINFILITFLIGSFIYIMLGLIEVYLLSKPHINQYEYSSITVKYTPEEIKESLNIE